MNLFQKKPLLIFEKMGLRQRLILFLTLVIVFSISSSNIMLMYYSKNRIISQSNELIGNTINQVSKNIEEVLSSRIYTISDLLMQDDIVYRMLTENYFAESESMLKIPDEEREKATNKVLFAYKITNKYLISSPGLQIAALCGKNGEITSISYSDDLSSETISIIKDLVKDGRGSNLVARFYFMKRNIFNSEVSEDKRENQVIIACRSLIRPDTGEYFGMVIFVIPERLIFNTYSSIKLGKNGEIFVFSNTGELISCSDEIKLGSLKVDNEYAQMLEDIEPGVNYADENDKRIMLVVQPLKGTEWFVAGKVKVSEISENVKVLLSITLIMIIVAILISLSFVSVLVESIVKPVRRIINAMKKAENGNLDVSVDVSGQYEISEIAKYFNSMIARIRTLILEEYETEKKKKEAELNILMGQINPHFLYNTLESIVWKAQMAGEPEISDMAASLGRLYRISVNRGTLQVKVSEELEHVKAYTEIQKLRYKDRFESEIIVKDKSILEYFTLKMILQPIVENAIVYCVERTTAFIGILIEVQKVDNSLAFSVTDNGTGMTPEEVEKLKGKINNESIEEKVPVNGKQIKYKGIGLKNINERIKLYFGDKYGLSIESEKDIGTKVSVTVPIIRDSNYRF